jgi:hypothetical protein
MSVTFADEVELEDTDGSQTDEERYSSETNEGSDSDCESMCMSDDFPATFAGEWIELEYEDEDLDEMGKREEEYIPPSLDSPLPDFTPLESQFSPHFGSTSLNPATIDISSPLAYFQVVLL